MSAEPPLDRAALVGVARSRYGLEVEQATFLPDGTAHAYRLEGPGGRVFAKVIPDTPSGQQLTRSLLAELPLLKVLRGEALLPRVPQALTTLDGESLARVEGYALILYQWIEATNLSSAWEGALTELAPLLGRLHAATPRILAAVQTLPAPPETFELPLDDLDRDLAALRQLGRGARPGLRALKALLAPHEPAIGRLAARLRHFQGVARRRPPRLVVCHTDAHGGNVMRDAAGQLWLVDWATARLAPPEHDLWMLHARLPQVLPAYQAEVGAALHPDPDLLGFYLCRRPLEDLAADLYWALHEHTRAQQDEATLDILTRFVLPAVQRAEDELDQLTAALG
ncbi:phosphotransferase [Deinococcus hohokamensis]|uniref:Phosphotransferase n=1 Tax=Deinococcus hohokamensis TaxID=309883 RepID=A0ABV9I553_9DEIO